jgi:transcriptional regulator with XRE-family HTH domain
VTERTPTKSTRARTPRPGQAARDVDGGPLIGVRLKGARLARRKTLTEVAEASGLTKSFVSKLERDQASASVASLMRLCQALDISVAELFEAHTGELVRAGQYPQIGFGGERLLEYLLTPRSEQRLQAILSEIEPHGGSGTEPYTLPTEVEFVFVLEGTLALHLGDEERVLERGDALTFSAETAHTFRNPDPDRTARVLWVCAPALPTSSTLRSSRAGDS